MGEVLRKLTDSPQFRWFVESKVTTCFMCKWIVEDLQHNKRLTGYPLDSMEKGTFMVEGKLLHVLLELGNELPDDSEDLETTAKYVLDALEQPFKLLF